MKPIDVIIVEDEQLFQEMLAISLSADAEIRVQSAFSNAAGVLDHLDALTFDAAILDIQIEGDMNGYELGGQLRRLRPEVGIIYLSNFLEYAFISAMRRRLAYGWSYLLKDSATDLSTLRRAVKGAVKGDIVLDSRITNLLEARKESSVAGLTSREREIMGLIAEGYSNRAIAERINITTKSVENYINRLFQKMNIDSGDQSIQPRVAAVLRYLRETRIR